MGRWYHSSPCCPWQDGLAEILANGEDMLEQLQVRRFKVEFFN